MNKHNQLFLTIKTYCGREKNIAEIDCFTTIAKEAGIPEQELDTYLSYLQSAGLIRYSMEEKYLYLTAFGRKQDKLISE